MINHALVLWGQILHHRLLKIKGLENLYTLKFGAAGMQVTPVTGGRGSNLALGRQNTTDKKPLDSICMSWNIHPMLEISAMLESCSWLSLILTSLQQVLQLL